MVRPRYASGGKEEVVGYSVALKSRAGDAPIWFGGGKLAKDLTLPHLRQHWETTAQDRQGAIVEWTANKSVAPGREALLGTPDDWKRALAGIERATERLGAYRCPISPPGGERLERPPACLPPGRGASKGTALGRLRPAPMHWHDRRRVDREIPRHIETRWPTSVA